MDSISFSKDNNFVDFCFVGSVFTTCVSKFGLRTIFLGCSDSEQGLLRSILDTDSVADIEAFCCAVCSGKYSLPFGLLPSSSLPSNMAIDAKVHRISLL